MKNTFGMLALTTALTLPALVTAKPVTFTVKLKNYGGNPAYLALYVTDEAGAYKGSLWMAGDRSKYYRHLGHWFRKTRGNLNEINGITGASVGSGQTLTVTLDLADTLFDAGYHLHIDAAAENLVESPSEVVLPLTSSGAGRPQSGRAYIVSAGYAL